VMLTWSFWLDVKFLAAQRGTQRSQQRGL